MGGLSRLIVKIIPLAVILFLAACGEPARPRQAPALVLPDLAGKTASLEALRGKPVLVSFWATWCDSCKEEMPELERLSKKLGDKAAVIGVSLDDDPASAVPPFAAKYRLTFPLLKSSREAVAAWAVRGLPTAFLIDPEGRIARRWVGAVDARAVENDILAMLNRRPS